MCFQEFSSGVPGFMDMVIDLDLVSVDKTVYRHNLTSNSRSRMLWPEQKSVVLTKDPVRKLSKPFDLVLDTFARTFSTVKRCLLLY